jgi:hypothetical protein
MIAIMRSRRGKQFTTFYHFNTTTMDSPTIMDSPATTRRVAQMGTPPSEDHPGVELPDWKPHEGLSLELQAQGSITCPEESKVFSELPRTHSVLRRRQHIVIRDILTQSLGVTVPWKLLQCAFKRRQRAILIHSEVCLHLHAAHCCNKLTLQSHDRLSNAHRRDNRCVLRRRRRKGWSQSQLQAGSRGFGCRDHQGLGRTIQVCSAKLWRTTANAA